MCQQATMIEWLDGAERPFVSAPGAQAGVLGGQVGVVGAGGGQCGSSSAQSSHLERLARLAGAAFAGGLVVAGALPGPRGELFGGWAAAHVDAGLGDDRLGGAPLNAGDRAQQLNGVRELSFSTNTTIPVYHCVATRPSPRR